jgi:hypothetical protein
MVRTNWPRGKVSLHGVPLNADTIRYTVSGDLLLDKVITSETALVYSVQENTTDVKGTMRITLPAAGTDVTLEGDIIVDGDAISIPAVKDGKQKLGEKGKMPGVPFAVGLKDLDAIVQIGTAGELQDFTVGGKVCLTGAWSFCTPVDLQVEVNKGRTMIYTTGAIDHFKVAMCSPAPGDPDSAMGCNFVAIEARLPTDDFGAFLEAMVGKNSLEDSATFFNFEVTMRLANKIIKSESLSDAGAVFTNDFAQGVTMSGKMNKPACKADDARFDAIVCRLFNAGTPVLTLTGAVYRAKIVKPAYLIQANGSHEEKEEQAEDEEGEKVDSSQLGRILRMSSNTTKKTLARLRKNGLPKELYVVLSVSTSKIDLSGPTKIQEMQLKYISHPWGVDINGNVKVTTVFLEKDVAFEGHVAMKMGNGAAKKKKN